MAASGGSGDDGGGGGLDSSGSKKEVKTSSTKTTKKNDINITGMGSRYIDGEISGTAIAVNALLALASLVAVAYLVFTAPSKDSPQLARTGDGPEYAKLGLVEEEQDGLA